MAETSGFYDAEELVSGNYDREYVSEQFAQYFALFIGNGVFASPTNQLKVVAGEGMNIVVKEGWAFIKGRWYHNDSDLVISVPPNTTAATINSGVFVQHSQSDRDIHSIIATGRTTPDREAPYWELKIAELQIPTGTTAITDAMITDTRTDESVCGFVKGLLQGVIPTADLFAQYDAIFMDFYNHMKDQLSEDAAGHLQIEIDNLSDSIAPQYDPSQTYGKGWVRMYHNKRYRSNQAITEPESWTPEHWTEENLDIALSEISDVNGRLTQVQSQIVPTASIESGETASKAYSVDDFLVKDGILYKVTKAIAKNDALTVGINIDGTTICNELSSISESLSQYKIKEYIFECTKTKEWMTYDIDESNAFLDGSSYLDTTNQKQYPLNYSTPSNDATNCWIEYKNGATRINFWSKYSGTVHAFMRYK